MAKEKLRKGTAQSDKDYSMAIKKKISLTKREQELLDSLISSAGSNYWQEDQGTRRNEVNLAAKHLEDDKADMVKLLLKFKRRIFNLKHKIAEGLESRRRFGS